MSSEHHSGIPWWKGAATHIWRVYFRFQRDGRQPDSDQKRKTFYLCNQILQEFNEDDVAFIAGYFQSPWGHDAEYLMEYADRTAIGTTYLWSLVEDCNRRFFEETGLLEPQRKEARSDDRL